MAGTGWGSSCPCSPQIKGPARQVSRPNPSPREEKLSRGLCLGLEEPECPVLVPARGACPGCPGQAAPSGDRDFVPLKRCPRRSPARPRPIRYPMAPGPALAEMYESSRGKNMHADPHLVSPIMEV